MSSLLNNNLLRTLGFVLTIVLLLVAMLSSVVLGYTDITWKMAVEAYTQFDHSNEHIIIKDTRVPRALIAAVVGASLGLAGALMQALTRNPLASPGIFGINAGAGFFVVCAISFFSMTSLAEFTWMAFLGAAIAASVVYVLGSMGREGLTPVRLTLAGAAIAAMFSSLTQGVLVMNEQALDQILFWLAGSIEGRSLDHLQMVMPYLLVAWIAALLIGKHINVLSMGEDMARGLGQRTWLIKVLSAMIIIIAAGGSVAVTGPIAFIGLVVPHFARYVSGIDYRWVIPYSALFGAILLIVADVGSRFIIMPKEVPVGVMTALIGVPFFVYIARKGAKQL
ncbi:FecCD family ABC transporter permease [Caldalkalibacillus salinus]|uniref:FecCD family ABC transporter permease n=1 Tax=Caldalkalibacillus salinus TaxID=2803787 RepID=UPI001920E9BC|nr:iron ABC transporter permease [Caldalkalibacillus salinus]